MVNINCIRFNSNHSAIIANLKTSSNKIVITLPYIMAATEIQCHFTCTKTLFPRVTVEHLAATKDMKIKLKMYN